MVHIRLRGHAPLARAVEERFRRLPGVLQIRVSDLTGSILVEFQPPMTAARLMQALEAAIADGPALNVGEASHTREQAAHAETIDALAARLETDAAHGLAVSWRGSLSVIALSPSGNRRA